MNIKQWPNKIGYDYGNNECMMHLPTGRTFRFFHKGDRYAHGYYYDESSRAPTKEDFKSAHKNMTLIED